MNKINNKSKEAEKRRREGESIFNKLGLSLNSELISIGLIFDNLLNSPINLLAFNNINLIFNNFPGVDLSIFTHNLTEPCVFVLAPILGLHFISSWTSPLIVFSGSTLKTAINSKSPKIYYYDWYNTTEEMVDQRVKIINKETIDNFDLVKLIKIIVEDLKNEKG